MTYKGSNWTRGELGNVPDENPRIDCADCGESFAWRDYWKPRVVEGDRVEDPRTDEPWRCDDCHERHERLTRRRENNQTLETFAEGRQENSA
ncbi:hypothetical protein [Haloferax sulfurifontis]|uniref:Uncharacterized protein n=1 Tax=Haloferax sulfurifontis ATCC BAA-897 TaxID=662480 RepID=M0IJI3_9EURY|nr:hypothetical protein [Haloferax sulfurifontis]ELZ96212.1 hypothetical protein C441_05204 [Haloferax sulfurifontis ATCC BAA-897]